jgi:UDP-glucose 4-epimerase
MEYYLNYYYKIFSLPYIVLRLGNVYGPRQDAHGEAGVIAIFTEKIKKLKVLNISGNNYSAQDLDIIKKGLPANVEIIK